MFLLKFFSNSLIINNKIIKKIYTFDPIIFILETCFETIFIILPYFLMYYSQKFYFITLIFCLKIVTGPINPAGNNFDSFL
jgi:hypothetical protein